MDGTGFVCECSDGYGGVRCDQATATFDLSESWDLAENPAPESVTPATPATATQPSQPIKDNPTTEAPATLQPWQPKPEQRVVEVLWDEQQVSERTSPEFMVVLAKAQQIIHRGVQ